MLFCHLYLIYFVTTSILHFFLLLNLNLLIFSIKFFSDIRLHHFNIFLFLFLFGYHLPYIPSIIFSLLLSTLSVLLFSNSSSLFSYLNHLLHLIIFVMFSSVSLFHFIIISFIFFVIVLLIFFILFFLATSFTFFSFIFLTSLSPLPYFLFCYLLFHLIWSNNVLKYHLNVPGNSFALSKVYGKMIYIAGTGHHRSISRRTNYL